MIIIHVEIGSYVLNLSKGNTAITRNSYWVTMYKHEKFKSNIYYSTIIYPKKFAFSLFAKMCSQLLTKKYISY